MSGIGALLPSALLFSVALAWMVRGLPLPRWSRAPLLLLLLLGALVPLAGGTAAAAWLRGFTGDLSVATLVLLCVGAAAFVARRPLIAGRDRLGLGLIYGGTGLIFYPCALGLSAFDPYAAGYAPAALATLALLLAAGAIAYRCRLTALALIAGVLGYGLAILESTNLWDYLMDPCLAVYTLIAGTREALSRVRPRAPHQTPKELTT